MHSLPIRLFIYLQTCPSACLFICPEPTHLSIYIAVYPFIYLSIYPCMHVSIYLSMYIYICFHIDFYIYVYRCMYKYICMHILICTTPAPLTRSPTATHCNTLQHNATHCDTQRYTATHYDILPHVPHLLHEHNLLMPLTDASCHYLLKICVNESCHTFRGST